MTYIDFFFKLKSIQKEYDDYYEEYDVYHTEITFSLNEVYFSCYVSESKNIYTINILNRNIPQNLLFKNIDIISESHNNTWLSPDYKYYEIDINDFFNKLRF